MSNCSICDRTITRSRPLYSNTNICSECLLKIKSNDYIIFTNNSDETLSDTSDHSSIKSKDCTLEDDDDDDGELFTIDANGTEVMVNEEINIEMEPKPVNCMENYKDALLASLYSQVDFLKNELQEKNLLIRTLIIKDADVHDYNEGPCSVSESADDGNLRVSMSEENNLINSSHVSVAAESPIEEFYNDDMSIATDDYFKTLRKEKLDNQLKKLREEKHHKYRVEVDNIAKQINEETQNRDHQYKMINNSDSNEKWSPNTILITGDSMINQMDEKRLSHSANRNVKVRSFSGADIDEMYFILPPSLKRSLR